MGVASAWVAHSYFKFNGMPNVLVAQAIYMLSRDNRQKFIMLIKLFGNREVCTGLVVRVKLVGFDDISCEV